MRNCGVTFITSFKIYGASSNVGAAKCSLPPPSRLVPHFINQTAADPPSGQPFPSPPEFREENNNGPRGDARDMGERVRRVWVRVRKKEEEEEEDFVPFPLRPCHWAGDNKSPWRGGRGEENFFSIFFSNLGHGMRSMGNPTLSAGYFFYSSVYFLSIDRH